MKKIIVTLVDGKATVKADGYKGETCKDATRLIEKALGQIIEDTPTSEMYEQDITDRQSQSL